MRTYEYCEHCKTEKEAEFVDIGIGWQQVTESRCPNMCDYPEWKKIIYANELKNSK